ncbi:MAG: hypothetical protein HQ567_19870 [Candidatus Nealsonbacteria bacterium]|nr:hypothetical protein [Candidatus Nealsonbacteria bacterium]
MTKNERTLAVVLRLAGLLALTAIFPAVMPFRWMVTIHAWLDLGELPDVPITHYLTRSLSMMYAVHGALVVYVSTDVRRFMPVIRFLVVVSILFGIGMLVLDCMVGLPLAWIIGEGPFIVALGVLLLWLSRPGLAPTE